jgi:hypothetical protein
MLSLYSTIIESYIFIHVYTEVYRLTLFLQCTIHIFALPLICCEPLSIGLCISPESIEEFIEDQVFSLSYDLAPPHPFPPVSKLCLFASLPVCCDLSCLLTGEPNHTTARKPGLLYIIQYSLCLTLQSFSQIIYSLGY